jgi:hypothetical protein
MAAIFKQAFLLRTVTDTNNLYLFVSRVMKLLSRS